MLSTPWAFSWGAAGGAATAVVLFLLPPLIRMHLEGKGIRFTIPGVLRELAILAIYAAVGGLAALVPAHVGRGQAIGLGFGVQTTLKALAAGGKEAIGRP